MKIIKNFVIVFFTFILPIAILNGFGGFILNFIPVVFSSVVLVYIFRKELGDKK
jgi:hypothetical protein